MKSRPFHRSRLTNEAVLLFVAFTTVNVSNFAFHMITSRVLMPSSYGALGSLLSLMLVLQVPIGAVQVAITQQVAAHVARLKDNPLARLGVGKLLRQMSLLAAGVALFFVAISPLLRSFLHLDSIVPCLLLALYMFPLMIGLAPRAVFVGEQRFRPLSIALVAGAATRLALGWVLGQTGFDVNGAMIATVAGETVTTALLLYPLLRTHTGNDPLVEALRIRLRDATAAGVAFAGLLSLVGIDTVLARHYLSRVDSGIYVAAATAARSALFLSTAVGLIAFPRFAAKNGEGPEARRALIQSLLVVVGLSLGAALFIAIFPTFFITLLMGSQYRAAADIVGTLAFGAAALGVMTLLVYFHLARRSPRAWFPWLGVVVLAGAIVMFHDSPGRIAAVVVITTAALTAITLVTALRKTSNESQMELAQRHRPPPPALESELDLTVVVPFYNPGPRFLPSLERLVDVLRQENVSFEVIAVSDGSTDGSAEALQELHSDVVRSVVLQRNWGKGEALRVGLSMGKGEYLGFIDADGDIDASHMKPFLALVQAYEPDIIVGSKRHPMSEVEYPAMRRIYSWGYQQLIRALFRLEVRDTQVGIKLLRRDIVAAVLPHMVERGFAFDLELLVVARKLGYRRVFEAPVRIGTRFTSTVSGNAVGNMFRDTLEILYRLRVLHTYDAEGTMNVWQAPPDAVEIPPGSYTTKSED